MINTEKKLYRKVNRKPSFQTHGSDYKKIHFRWERHTKKSKNLALEGVNKIPMKKGKSRVMENGYDYTPLFKYLLKQVGRKWDDVYSEVIPRLNTTEPVFWMVDVNNIDDEEYFKAGETSFYSKLYVDDNGILCKVNPKLSNIHPNCNCHTYTFNGNVVGNKSYNKIWR